jgi:hypothetical protein
VVGETNTYTNGAAGKEHPPWKNTCRTRLQSFRFKRAAPSTQAEMCSEELRSVMLAIGDAYELLAHVQKTLDDDTAVYASPSTH